MSNTNKINRRQAMLALEIGETTPPFPIAEYNSVKANCYSYGVETGRIFSLKANRESGTVTVTRKA